jgi:hypothetical protein
MDNIPHFTCKYIVEEVGYSAYVTLDGAHYWTQTDGDEQEMRDSIVDLITEYKGLNPSQYALEFLPDEKEDYDEEWITSVMELIAERAIRYGYNEQDCIRMMSE